MERMNVSNCFVDDWAVIEAVGGAFPYRVDFPLGSGVVTGCWRLDSADRNRLTCFLPSQHCPRCHAHVLFMQVSSTSIINLPVPKVAITEHFKDRP